MTAAPTVTLSAERRRLVCIHEAGHAVIHALGGAGVYALAVAPVGATAWRYRTRKGAPMSDLWGVCEPAGCMAAMFLRWDDAERELAALRQPYRDALAMLDRHHRGSAAEVNRQTRAHLCAALAGPAAEQIAQGEAEPYLHEPANWSPRDDILRAHAFDRLLPWRGEFDHAAELVLRTLRTPQVWAAVLRVADALERKGRLTRELPRLLPQALPAWPPGPRHRAARAVPGVWAPVEARP